MTYQTSVPVRSIPMNISSRPIDDLTRQLQKGTLTYELPYQRGDVWTNGQRMMLIYSVLAGTPIPALIINDRPMAMWYGPTGKCDQPIYAVIDGKQRLTALLMFVTDQLTVPASWFPADRIAATEATSDGPYVRWSRLTVVAQRFFSNTPIPAAIANVASVEAEAEIYLRVNGSGTPQTAADMTNAARVAGR
jgi:Protein of unknown function DUF262